jgi:hypothetical protein
MNKYLVLLALLFVSVSADVIWGSFGVSELRDVRFTLLGVGMTAWLDWVYTGKMK